MVNTNRKNSQIYGPFDITCPVTCLHMTIFSYYLDAILDLRVKDMSEYKTDARNKFPIFELARIDLLDAKKKKL